jgi:hypothetical protein
MAFLASHNDPMNVRRLHAPAVSADTSNLDVWDKTSQPVEHYSSPVFWSRAGTLGLIFVACWALVLGVGVGLWLLVQAL